MTAPRNNVSLTTYVVRVIYVAKNAVYLRGVEPGIIREAKAVAAREGITLAALVQRALVRETQSARPAPSRVSEIAEDMRWYEENAAALLERFEGEHLAIVDRKVVDHDLDLQALASRVEKTYGARSVYMPECRRTPRVAEIRSPRIAR